jgi:tetratricopeptide (TPR) repeat protein
LCLAGAALAASQGAAAGPAAHSPTTAPSCEAPNVAVAVGPDLLRDVLAARHTDRRASAVLADAGWQRVHAQHLDEAVQLFNAAWASDPGNYDAYWGMGAVLQARGQIDEAIVLLEQANRLPDIAANNRAPLLSDLGNVYSIKALLMEAGAPERAQYFARAGAIFRAAVSMSPGNPQPWLQWIVALLYQERYVEAWRKVAEADELRHRIPEELLASLRMKTEAAFPLP